MRRGNWPKTKIGLEHTFIHNYGFCDTPVYLCNCRANRHTLCISLGSNSLLIWVCHVMSHTPRIRVVTKFSAHPRTDSLTIYPPFFVNQISLWPPRRYRSLPLLLCTAQLSRISAMRKARGETHTQMRHTVGTKETYRPATLSPAQLVAAALHPP